MGGWKLEVFRMSLYMAFPVGCFWWFNQPSFFESWMVQKSKELFWPEDPRAKEKIRRAIEAVDVRRQRELDREFEESLKKQI
jgi:protein PET100